MNLILRRLTLRRCSVLLVCIAVGCSGGDDPKDGADSGQKPTAGGDSGGGKPAGGKPAGGDKTTPDKNMPANDSAGGSLTTAPGTITLTPENTTIEFTGSKKDGTHSGAFKAVSGTLEMGESGPKVIDLRIETNSLHSDDEKLTDQLLGPDFIDVISFPKAALVSQSITPALEGDATHTLTAKLELRGNEHTLSIPLKVEQSGSTLKITAEFTLSRKQFGIGEKNDDFDDEVKIRAQIDSSNK